MALVRDFELVCTSLLHRHPLPTFGSGVAQLIFEETKLGMLKPEGSDASLRYLTYPSMWS